MIDRISKVTPYHLKSVNSRNGIECASCSTEAAEASAPTTDMPAHGMRNWPLDDKPDECIFHSPYEAKALHFDALDDGRLIEERKQERPYATSLSL